MAVCVALFLLVALSLLGDFFQKRQAARNVEEAVDSAFTVNETSGNIGITPPDLENAEIKEEAEEIAIDFDALRQLNPDIIGWILVPETNINYPILQSPEELDTDYYLNTNLDGSQGYPGSIYIQKRNSPYFTDPLTVVYGHNMKNGSMFATLHNYEDETFFQENPYIYVYTEKENAVYEVFAAVWFDNRLILDYYDDFLNEGDLTEFLTLLKDYPGIWNDSISVSEEADTLIGLSTCISQRPDERFYVFGRKLSKEEKTKLPEEEKQKVVDILSEGTKNLESN